ncbi:RNA-binding protein [bacterium]|nr:RNA-binding protein [bacterium]
MNIYVGNLRYNLTEEALKDVFTEFGEVVSVKIVRDRFSGESKGFGFVEMASDDDAKKAIADLNGKEVDGRALRVNEARPREERPRR